MGGLLGLTKGEEASDGSREGETSDRSREGETSDGNRKGASGLQDLTYSILAAVSRAGQSGSKKDKQRNIDWKRNSRNVDNSWDSRFNSGNSSSGKITYEQANEQGVESQLHHSKGQWTGVMVTHGDRCMQVW